jgi:FixJ family two-component response regulator
MKHGAVDFLTKPVDQEDLLQAIQSAIAQDLVRVETNREVNQLKLLLESLTRREHQVMTYVITGLLNKQIAWELGITEDTVKIHRHRVMKKLKIESVAELVRFCAKAGVEPVQIQDAEL